MSHNLQNKVYNRNSHQKWKEETIMKRRISRVVQVVIVSLAMLVMTCMPVFAATNITEAQAKIIALKDAGLKEKNIIILKLELDEGSADEDTEGDDSEGTEAPEDAKTDDSQEAAADADVSEDAAPDAEAEETEVESDEKAAGPRYVIEFFYDGTEYEYESDAATGDILKVSKDTEFFLNPGALPSSLP
jgi:uncharacterized membrane protein YkoI